jgi:D-glycero-D-manno-heptose 1,7-bisphosphate phosphatase
MKFLILDRDGVINVERLDFVKTPDEWVALPGALEAIARFNRAGWRVVVATNQSGLGRGLFDTSALNAIHTKFRAELTRAGGNVEGIFMCPHTPDEGCDCRKPSPGMFLDIGRRFDIDLTQVHSVGDSARDLIAAKSVGCKTWLVLTGNGAKTLAAGDLPEGTRICADLAAVADELIPPPKKALQG